MCSESSFLKSSISQNLRKAFFWQNITNFLILGLESSFSWNIRILGGGGFFYYFELGLKSGPGSPMYNYGAGQTRRALNGYSL